MRTLKTLERWLMGAEKALLIAFIVVMVVLSFLQVVLRGLFSSGLLWADTFLRHLVLWVGFLGAALAASGDKQFAMDAATRLLSGRLRSGVQLLCHAFTALVCGFLASASWTFLRDEFGAGAVLFSVGGLHVPSWVFEVILPAGFLLLLVHYAVKAACAALELRGPDGGSPADDHS
ncbi:MAG: TRAP transporter small permease subunit [Elusimicrobiota bacterium]